MSHFSRRRRSSSSPPSPLPPLLKNLLADGISFQLQLQSLQEVKVDHEIVSKVAAENLQFKIANGFILEKISSPLGVLFQRALASCNVLLSIGELGIPCLPDHIASNIA
nr:hypothetical protein Iba_chr01fCG9820 [Ipomoea batatas]